MKTKILHIVNLSMNGKAIFVCNLLNETDYSLYEITILNFWGGIAEPIQNRLSDLPVKIINPTNKGFIGFLEEYISLLKTEKYDVVHSHMWDLSGLFLAIAKHYNVPIRVCHSHNSQKVKGRYNPIHEFIRDKIVWNFLKYLIEKKSNRRLACSDLAVNWLYTPKAVEDGVKILHYGIDLNVFKPAIEKRKGHNLLFIGRLIHQKNPLFLLDVFKYYAQKHPDAILTIVGDGNLRNECDAYIDNNNLRNKIIHYPSASNTQELYQKADLFILPSFYEGLGIVLVEAQATALPCLASDTIPALADCGMIKFKSLNDGAESWASAIDEVMDSNMTIDYNKLNEYSNSTVAKIVYDFYKL